MESKQQSPLEEDILSRDVNKAIEEAHTLSKVVIIISHEIYGFDNHQGTNNKVLNVNFILSTCKSP